MQAIQGVYDNGILKLDKKAPANKSRVIALFTEDETQKKMSVDEALRIYEKYAGSVKGDVDLEAEKDAYFNEKNSPESPAKRPFSDLFGEWRGMIWMSDDFDEPLEDFKEYME